MLASLKGIVALVVAGMAALSTYVSIGHVHPTPAAHHFVSRPASTSLENLDGGLIASNPRLPDPTPAPAAADDQSNSAPADDQSNAAPAAAAAPVWRPAAPPPAPAPPPVVVGSAQQSYINGDRAAAGLPPLTWSSCLAGIAAGQSAAMASRGSIFHGNGVNQDFGCGLGSSRTGENVGYTSGGINDALLNNMFMNSPEHRANIMGPYRYVGTAWKVAPNGYAYITVEFA